MLFSIALLFFTASAEAQLPSSVADFAQQLAQHVASNLQGELMPIAFPCGSSLQEIKSLLPNCLEEVTGSQQLECTGNCTKVFASVASLDNPDCADVFPSNLVKIGKSLESYCQSPMPEVVDILRSPDPETMKSETLDLLTDYVPAPVASLLMVPIGAFIDGLDRWS